MKKPKRKFLRIQINPAEEAILKRKYGRGVAARISKQMLLGLKVELPRDSAAIKSRRELNAHLALIGNNINQISRAMNRAALEGHFSPDAGLQVQAILLDIFTQIVKYKHDHRYV
jgi:hypothetical protein